MRSLFKQALKVDPKNMHSLQVCRFHPQFIVVSFLSVGKVWAPPCMSFQLFITVIFLGSTCWAFPTKVIPSMYCKQWAVPHASVLWVGHLFKEISANRMHSACDCQQFKIKKLLSPIEATYFVVFQNFVACLLLQAWAHQEALLGTDESRHQARKLYQRCIEVNPDSVHAWQVTLTAIPSISFTVLHCFCL